MQEKKIKQLFAAVLQSDLNEIDDESTPDTLNRWDSLNHLTLIAMFEEEFSIDIDPEEIPGMMENFGRFKSIITQKIL